MFAISSQELALSPHCMRFKHLWIYDLRVFHHFWRNKVREENCVTGPSAWSCVLSHYQISLFSPIEQIRIFAQDYHQHFRTKNLKKNRVSHHSIEKIFKHFRRVGIFRVGDLKKIPFNQIQKRFGKSWRVFFQGILEPESSEWSWEAYRKNETLSTSIEPDYSLTSTQQVNELCLKSLNEWSNQNSQIFVEKIKISLSSFEIEEDQEIDLFFSNRPELTSQLTWIKRVLEDRLQELDLKAPISCLRIQLEPSLIKSSVQLSLFEDRQSSIEWQSACERLIALGFDVFQPKAHHSYRPEDSWVKDLPFHKRLLLPHIRLRPLVQFHPQPISKPESRMSFTERIEFFDSDGIHRKRDYFIHRDKRHWAWIFKNEKEEWFEQGIVE